MANMLLVFLLGVILEVQTDWHVGPGNIGPLPNWYNGAFDSANNLSYSIPNQLTLTPTQIDTANWRLYTIDTNTGIKGHNFILPIDMDGDADNDLVAAFSTYVVWYEQGDTFSFTKHIVSNDFTVGSHGTAWPCDLDSDWDSDLLVSGDSGLVWFENDGLTFTKHLIASSGWYQVRTGDLENDGDIDIVAQKGNSNISTKWEGALYVFKNDGNENFVSVKIPNGDTTWRNNLEDFNKDGYLDIQTSAYNAKCVRVYFNDGMGNFNLVYRYNVSDKLDGSWPSDINADGFMDIGVSAQNGDFFWLENDGTGGNYIYHPVTNGITRYGDGGMAVDIDLSGRVDIIGGYRAIGWFEQLPDGTWEEHFLGSASDCHWVYGCNMGEGTCDDLTDIVMDILFTDNGKFGLWKNKMVGNYEDHGWLESSVLDASKKARWLRFGWHDCIPDGYEVKYRVRTGNSIPDIKTTSWSAPRPFSGDSLIGIVPEAQYFQYRIEIDDTIGNATGAVIIDTIWVEYELKEAGITEVENKKSFSISCKTGKPEISYTISISGFITLKMYDVTGRLVKLLDESERQAGTYTIPCESGTGVYFVRLTLEGKTIVAKRVVIN